VESCSSDRRRSRSARQPLAAALALVVAAALCVGFVLPPSFVLERSRERLQRLAGLEILIEVEQGDEVYPETLRFVPGGGLDYRPEQPRPGTETLRRLLSGDFAGLLQELGIDPRRAALDHQDGWACVTVGARAGERAAPQLWIDQESWFPARLSVGGRELLLHDLRSPQTRGVFPRRIEMREGGRLVWQARTLRVRPLP